MTPYDSNGHWYSDDPMQRDDSGFFAALNNKNHAETIGRLTADNERLQAERDKWYETRRQRELKMLALRQELRDARAEIERLQTEVALLTVSRREIIEIDEGRVAEIERLQADYELLWGWQDRAKQAEAEIERLQADVAELSRCLNGIGNRDDLAEKVLANPSRIHRAALKATKL